MPFVYPGLLSVVRGVVVVDRSVPSFVHLVLPPEADKLRGETAGLDLPARLKWFAPTAYCVSGARFIPMPHKLGMGQGAYGLTLNVRSCYTVHDSTRGVTVRRFEER